MGPEQAGDISEALGHCGSSPLAGVTLVCRGSREGMGLRYRTWILLCPGGPLPSCGQELWLG